MMELTGGAEMEPTSECGAIQLEDAAPRGAINSGPFGISLRFLDRRGLTCIHVNGLSLHT